MVGASVKLSHHRLSWCVGLALSILATLPSFVWIARDRRVWRWDQSWYAEVSTDLYWTLTNELKAWPGAMAKAIALKPPLLTWIGQFFVPIGLVTGNIEFALLLVPVLAHAATLLVLYLAARRIAPESVWPAAVAALIIAAAPLFVALSHQFLVESLQDLIVASSVLAALGSRDVKPARGLAILLFLVACGFLIKSSTLAYCGLFWLISITNILRRWRFRPLAKGQRMDLAMLTLAAGFAAAGVFWYRTNFAWVVQHIRNAVSVEVGSYYGSQLGFSSKLKFWLSSANSALFVIPFLFPILAGALTLFAAARLYPDRAGGALRLRTTLGSLVVLAAALHVIVVVLQFCFQIVEDTRYLSPLIPLVAIVCAVALSNIDRRVAVIVAGCLAIQLAAVYASAFGRLHVTRSPYLVALTSDVGDKLVARAVVNATCPAEVRARYVVVGVENPEMNANSLAFLAAVARLERGWRCYYTGLGHAETDPHRALAKIETLDARYLVFPLAERLPAEPNFLNRVVRDVLTSVSQDERYVKTQSFGDYQVLKRVAAAD